MAVRPARRLGDWLERLVPARWQLMAMLPEVSALDRDDDYFGSA